MPQKWVFSSICDPPRFFFKNRALSLLYPYGALTSCKKLEKSLERSLRYLKTDGRTDMGDYIGPSRVNPGSKMNSFKKKLKDLLKLISQLLIMILPQNVFSLQVNSQSCSWYHYNLPFDSALYHTTENKICVLDYGSKGT